MSTEFSAARGDLAPGVVQDRADALRVLVEVDDLLDNLCRRLLDLYGRPTLDSPTQERHVGA